MTTVDPHEARTAIRAIESVFVSVVAALESEMVFTRHLVGGLLAELEEDIDRDKFKRLLHYSRRLGNFQNRVKLVCRLTFPRKPQAPPLPAILRIPHIPRSSRSRVPLTPHI
jgi:hypothetical protein